MSGSKNSEPAARGLPSRMKHGRIAILVFLHARGKNVSDENGTPFIETTAQFPRDQVRVGLAMALAQKWGARVVPSEVPIDVRVVDAENAADFSW